MFESLDVMPAKLLWRPLGGWDARSGPERVKKKVPLVRQDVKRWCRRLSLAFNPPPAHTDPTRAAMGSLLAEARGLLRPYVAEVMRAEWGEGQDIGEPDVLIGIAARIGLDGQEFKAAFDDPGYRQRLDDHWAEAERLGVIAVAEVGRSRLRGQRPCQGIG